jgi:4-hydroxy-3-methylbut-2-enyl diphosphate reductase
VSERLLIAAPMRIEARLAASGARRATVHRTGIGPKRAQGSVGPLQALPGDTLLVLGFCGALGGELQPGEIVVAERVYAAADEGHAELSVACAGADALAATLAQNGLRARTGEVVCVGKLALGERREQLFRNGAIAVDMESAWLAAAAQQRPFAVVRIVLDTPERELLRPQTAPILWRASGVLRRAARTLDDLAATRRLNTLLRGSDDGGDGGHGQPGRNAQREV